MLRSMFGRPRSVRAPVRDSKYHVQTVNVVKKSRQQLLSHFVLSCAISYCVIRGIRYLDPLSNYSQRDAFQDQQESLSKNSDAHDGQRPQDMRKFRDTRQKLENLSQGMKGNGSGSQIGLNTGARFTLPIWLRKGPTRAYDFMDPEFMEFAKLQGDAKRVAHIKHVVADTVARQVVHQRTNSTELQLIGFQGQVVPTLDIVPQVFVPPTYQVPCMWLSFTSVGFGWRSLPPDTGNLMERVFRPLVLLDASTAACKAFFFSIYGITKAKLNERMGWGRHIPGARPTISMPRPSKKDQDEPSDMAQAGAITKSEKPTFSFVPDLKDGQAMRKMHQDVVSAMPYSVAIQNAASLFNHVRNLRQKAAVSQNVRGVCQIRGFLTFLGKRGKYKLEVVAHYLPAENMFLGAVMIHQGYVVQNYQAWHVERQKNRQKQQQQQQDSSARQRAEKLSEEQMKAQHDKKMSEKSPKNKEASNDEGNDRK